LSEDENSASNSEDGDDSKVSYQSMEDDYLQQLPEFEFSDSEDDSRHSSNESVYSNKSNMQHQLSAADKGLKNDDKRIYFAQLLGMSDHISYNLSNNHFQVAKYVPYGPVKDVLPYLIRRADENTSVAGQTSRELSLISKERTRRKNHRK
jgi:proline dehydrogenase